MIVRSTVARRAVQVRPVGDADLVGERDVVMVRISRRKWQEYNKISDLGFMVRRCS